ncbi:hypothetical protein K466DRAFT_570739 [Polyporus arcularius HHB13444]|uniref:Uncharacterized protein n=1 Tax=Polyporus arcularius HHB13444 TaxID=1314778 RepID=A0A5C3NPI8_9APHY|nr:hypothetical protein K466DRAFT_570739 [Polyporus arcularius HHB13444]
MEVLGYGLPQWAPATPLVSATIEADSSPHPAEVIPGSVIYPKGYGRFSILLNTMKPGDDKAWQPKGVPDDFQTLQEFAGTTLRGLTYCNIAGKPKTRAEGEVIVSASRLIDPVRTYDLHVWGGSGAFLATVDTPISVSIQPHLPVESYMLENHAHWMRMGDLIPLEEEDLYFVLGTITTTRWLVGSHLGAFEGMGHICCTIPDVFSDLYRGLIRADEDCRMPTINHGHSPSTPMSNNQCLFVHYAKLKRRPARTGVQWLWYKLRSCFRGHLHTSKASGDHQSWEVLPPSQPPPQDPVDVLLNYILKKQPDADTATASSLDIVDLFKACVLST